MCGCQKPKSPASPTPSSMLSSSGNFSQQSIAKLVEGSDKNQMVTVEYTGPIVGTFTINSRVSREVSYRFGNNDFHRTRSVFLGDAEWLIGMNDREGNPTYKILSNVSISEVNDPAAFVGQAITA